MHTILKTRNINHRSCCLSNSFFDWSHPLIILQAFLTTTKKVPKSGKVEWIRWNSTTPEDYLCITLVCNIIMSYTKADSLTSQRHVIFATYLFDDNCLPLSKLLKTFWNTMLLDGMKITWCYFLCYKIQWMIKPLNVYISSYAKITQVIRHM